jgi:CRISPR-associated protein Csm4
VNERYVELVVRIQVEAQLAYWIRGDILFGQMCRAYADLFGNDAMNRLALQYVTADPWCVVSDARPEGYIPRPCVPIASLYSKAAIMPSNEERKTFKHKIWVPRTAAMSPLDEWGGACMSAAEIAHRYDCKELSVAGSRIWWAVNRNTRVQSGRAMASYLEVSRSIPLELTIIVDTGSVTVAQVAQCVAFVGLEGYGRRHSSGWGRFNVLQLLTLAPTPPKTGQSLLTLAPSAPQGMGMSPHRSWYKPFVHMGKLGPAQTEQSGPIGKTPLLLAQTGAVFTPSQLAPWTRPFFGQAIGGNGKLSKRLPGAIHQGFAPYVPVDVPLEARHERHAADSPAG